MRSESYTFLDDDICKIVFEFYGGRVYLHCNPKAAGYRVAWRLAGLRDSMAGVLRSLGYRSATVGFRTNPGWQRLLRKFGFVTRAQRAGWVFMEVQDACCGRR